MLKRETMSYVHIPKDRELLIFSAQYQYKSFFKGRPKCMLSINARIENNQCFDDMYSKMTKKVLVRTNVYREKGYMLNKEIIMDGLFLFHCVQTYAACLHSSLI